jgi:hypothetical protein
MKILFLTQNKLSPLQNHSVNAVYENNLCPCDSLTKHTNTLCRQNADFLKVTILGACSYCHWILRLEILFQFRMTLYSILGLSVILPDCPSLPSLFSNTIELHGNNL